MKHSISPNHAKGLAVNLESLCALKPDELAELAAVIGSFMMYNTFVTILGLKLEAKNPIGSLLHGT